MNHDQDIWGKLCELIQQVIGLDITKYRRNILQRRLETWGQRHYCTTLEDIYDFLKTSPEKIQELVNYITVDVSSFFRNREVFEFIGKYLQETVSPGQYIRIGSFGCGRGQEPYTLAFVLWKVLDPGIRWSILALDIDRMNVHQGKAGVYNEYELKGMTAEEKELFFEWKDEMWCVREDIKERVTWIQANLFTLPLKESIFDVVLCRNLAIFMIPSAHEELFEELSRVLREGGLLVLGLVERVPRKWQSYYHHVSRPLHIFRYYPDDRYGG